MAPPDSIVSVTMAPKLQCKPFTTSFTVLIHFVYLNQGYSNFSRNDKLHFSNMLFNS